jgi:hypothetical protein
MNLLDRVAVWFERPTIQIFNIKTAYFGAGSRGKSKTVKASQPVLTSGVAVPRRPPLQIHLGGFDGRDRPSNILGNSQRAGDGWPKVIKTLEAPLGKPPK